MKLLYDNNGFIRSAVSNGTCTCNNSMMPGMCDHTCTGSYEPGLTGVRYPQFNHNMGTVVDKYSLPLYKWDSINEEMLLIEDYNDYQVDNVLWDLLIKRERQYFIEGKIRTIPLEIYKILICEKLDRDCDIFVTNGFYSSCKNNTSLLYGLSLGEMTLINSQTLLMILGSNIPIAWRDKNSVLGSVWTPEEWVRFNFEAEAFTKTAMFTVQGAKEYILAAESKEAIDTIVAGVTLNNIIS